MFSKLNYFNKLICTFLIVVTIMVCCNSYLLIAMVVLAFAYSVFSDNFKSIIFSLLIILLNLLNLNGHLNIYIFKFVLIILYIYILFCSLNNRERRIFLEHILYNRGNNRKLINKIYLIQNKNDKNNNCRLMLKRLLNKEQNKRAKEEIKDIVLFSKLKYYGINNKRSNYKLTIWTNIDTIVIVICIIVLILAILMR